MGIKKNDRNKIDLTSLFHNSNHKYINDIYSSGDSSKIINFPRELIGIHKDKTTFPIELSLSINKFLILITVFDALINFFL